MIIATLVLCATLHASPVLPQQDSLDHPEEVDWFPVVQRVLPPLVDGTKDRYHTFGFLRSASDDDSILTACSTGPGHPVILRSTDFGSTWNVAYDPGYQGYDDVPKDGASVPDGFVCYVMNRGRVIISRDAGRTWHEQRLDTIANINAVDFIDPMNGILRWGYRGVDALRTSDGGNTWDSVRITGVYVNSASSVIDIAMTGLDTWTIFRGYQDTTWSYVTRDGGTTWNMTTLPPRALTMKRMGGSRLWAFCLNYLHPDDLSDFRTYDEVWESEDAGLTWKRLIKANVAPPWGVRDAVRIGGGLQVVGGSANKLYFVEQGDWKVQKVDAFGLPEAAVRNLHRHRENVIFGTIGPDFFRMTYVPSHTSSVDDDGTSSPPTSMVHASPGSRVAIGRPLGSDPVLHATTLDGSDVPYCFSIDDGGNPALIVHRTTAHGIYAVTIDRGSNNIHRMLLIVR
ncbi:MAG: hypothetical protein J0I17_03875 ['Candidatus Kapabacteria' thiocyanatum]|mgnify:CR=1 FL=1|uniref:Photosynthesis system II assembly factor Ycf48/Hcf136-like domain-containing protein n=1 Tax=Candidatus Kapaibacterium thiocyanatum TaxID=1895771 RepID=A0A1M3KY15_9BACT|nr:hypothetical protein ['Candidatus Kapabacteria' thiocyanatum]OJX57280.1 MAG: hypothetical protein BGO89_12405 ['Candidatus Kapabacteria' thiocyanatum]